jgi:uncharacterized protein YPO0396
MEILNWGTFDKEVFKINPQGNNSLMTGANASGKSTYIDALLTLLVPAKKDRFYNQSSGVDKKGDRNEKTYVLGNYGNIQEDGKNKAIEQTLRNTNTYSVILASFANTEKQITLFQVRWFSNNELKRQFGIATIPLEIKKDFSQFDAKGKWKKRLDKTYNSNSSKRKIEFIDGPMAYAERLSHLLGMRSVKALSLFNQVVGVKVLDDLNDFIRTNMLEEKDAEAEFIQLKESFLTLMDAKISIEKSKEQILQLTPINEIAIQLEKLQESLTKLEKSKEMAAYWFAKKGVELGEKELEKCIDKLDNLNEELTELRSKESELKDQEADLKVQIKLDEVGNQIDKLKTEITKLEKSRDLRIEKLDDYNKTAQGLKLDSNPSKETFIENREEAKQLKKIIIKKIEEENENFRLLKNKADELKSSTGDLVKTIQLLRANKNNITGREAGIRDEIIENIGASREEIPFIGELIKVKEDEMNWESSIEKVLHNFALRLIVPSKYYSEVNKYVNATNLRGRIRYDKYEGKDHLKNFRNRNINKKSLVNKVEIKPKTPYYEWIENYLESQFNFTCVDNLSEFESYSEMAITSDRLIKFRKGQHEKDDRKYILKKENYVLGWDNKEKIDFLKAELRKQQELQIENKKEISVKGTEINDLDTYKDDCNSLFSLFTKYDEINWHYYANQIQEKTEQKEALEKANDKVEKLLEQLRKVEADLKNVSEVEIKSKDREIFQTEERQKSIESNIENNKALFEPLVNIDSSEFENQNSNLLKIEYANFEISRKNFQDQNLKEIQKLKEQKRNQEDEVRIKINSFKKPSEDITDKFKDWRSDVNSLPESTQLDFIDEYQKFLQTLQKDNLPKFEKKFNDYLQETITDKINEFRIFFINWEESIKKNVNYLNDSLREIDFKDTPKTYIQLVAVNKISDEVKNFKNLLDAAIPNMNDVNSVKDGRKNHFNNHIEPFILKMDNENFRTKVMDVRSWFTYKAEEFYKESNRKHKTYENMGSLSGGEKAQLTYTILGSAIAYQFGLTKEGLQSESFQFIAIDEAFKAQDEDKALYLITLCKQLHLQLLVVTPSDNIHIVEPYISFVHFIERKEEKYSWLYDMPIEQFLEEKANYLKP